MALNVISQLKWSDPDLAQMQNMWKTGELSRESSEAETQIAELLTERGHSDDGAELRNNNERLEQIEFKETKQSI